MRCWGGAIGLRECDDIGAGFCWRCLGFRLNVSSTGHYLQFIYVYTYIYDARKAIYQKILLFWSPTGSLGSLSAV